LLICNNLIVCLFLLIMTRRSLNLILLFISLFLTYNKLFSSDGLTIVFPKEKYVFYKSEDIYFKFNKSLYDIRYNIQISTNSTFSTLVVNDIIYSNYFNPNLVPFVKNIDYYWRVRPVSSSNWSEISLFKIYDPLVVSGLNLWLKADSNYHLTTNKVDSWKNIVYSNDSIATQSVLSNMPSYIPSIPILNNFPVLKFQASLNNFLTFNNKLQYTDFTLITLRNYISNGSDAQFVLGGDNNSGVLADASVIGYGYGLINNSERIGAKFSEHSSEYSIYTHTNNLIRKNKVTTSPIKLAVNNPLSGINFSTIGRRPDNFSYMYNGDLAEIITYDRKLDEEEMLKIEGYLQYKYSPLIDLGLDTIYGSSFCDTIRLYASEKFETFLWSTGDTASSIVVPANGKYSVTVKDIFGFVSIDDIVVLPYTQMANTFVTLCDGDTLKLDLQTPAGFTALWNTGLNNTKINITQAGQYTVKITDNSSCFVFDTINVVMDKPVLMPTPDISNNLNICLNEKLFLTATTPFDSIHWSTGSHNAFINITAPGAYSVYGRTATGCVINKNFTINITGQAPTAKFGTNALCEDAATIFTDSSMAASGSTITQWQWTFGDGNTSFSNSPINIYTNSGTYNVGFKVSTNQGCADSISKTLVVNKRPTASFYNLLSCSGLPTTFVDQSNANAASNINWQWQFGNLGISNGIKNPTFQFPNAGAYNVTLAVTNSNNCRDSITLPISVNASPSAHFAFDSACGTSPIHFQYLATVQPPATLTSWKWEFGDGNIQTAIKNTDHIYPGPGAYNAKLTVFSSDQCSNTVEKEVKVFDFPVVDFSISPTQCVGKDIHFTDISYTVDGSPMANWNWYFSGQASSNQQHPTYAFQQQGNYTIQLTAKNNVGCSGTKLRSIAVSDPPIPKFTFSPQNGLPPLVVNFINQTSTSSNFIWDFGDGSTPYIGQQAPAHTYNTLGSYPIKLTATDFRGCSDSLVKQILVDKAVLDAVMTGITLIPSGENYKVQITLVNNSNVEIRNLGLALQVGSGTQVVENWEGSLLPNQTLTYNFIGQVKLSDNSIPIVCANIDQVNHGATETRTDNNRTCKETAVGNFEVLSVYPNPAEEILNFGIMLPKNGSVNIQFIDVLGQYLQSKTFTGTKGYNLFPMNTMPLNAAVYVAEITFDGQTIRKKFMRKDK